MRWREDTVAIEELAVLKKAVVDIVKNAKREFTW